MSHILNGTANWRDGIPVPSDGDLADEASITQAIQQVANNLRWLFELTTSRGVTAVRRVVDLPALKAMRDMADGQVTYVASRGIYLYVDPNATAEGLPWAVAPTLGTGVWFHPLYALRNVPGGIAVLDVAGRLPREALPLSLVQAPIYVEPQGYGVNPTTAWADVPSAEARVSGVRAGDILELDAQVAATATQVNDQVLFLRFLAGATGTRQSKARFGAATQGGAAAFTTSLIANYTCVAADEAAGSVLVKVQMSASGLLPCSIEPTNHRVRHLRP